MRVLCIEPYFGGSHRQFLEGYLQHSSLEIDLLTLPARKWKWRMRGAAMTFAQWIRQEVVRPDPPDAILASDFLDLVTFLSLVPESWQSVPSLVYFHENQLTYPVREEKERDYHYGFTNITTGLKADRVLFNSQFHRDSFLGAVDRLLGRMPDHVPEGIAQDIEAKSLVIPVGIDLLGIDRERHNAPPRKDPPLILWNHRWEHDKNPDGFFKTMDRLQNRGIDFRLAVAGESFRESPSVFNELAQRFKERLAHCGYLPSRKDYIRLLLSSDIVVSTAIHEFFGISVIEAIYAGCFPLLPTRLSYPEILDSCFHERHLYKTESDLLRHLVHWIQRPEELRSIHLSQAVQRFDWSKIAPQIDEAITTTSLK